MRHSSSHSIMAAAWFISIFMALSFAFPSTAADHRIIKLTCPTIVVGRRGHFRTIQSAIDSVPPFNNKWICIRIQQGVYREKLYIPYGKSFIYLMGAGMRRTYVVWDGHDPIDTTATFTTQGDNIIVDNISFNNSYNYPPIGSVNPRRPAVAAKIEGDKSAFYRVGFFGLQDTLWDVDGRHYFKQCTIEGAVDFIFGSGQSIYDSCLISVVALALNGGPGYITAQGREDPNDKNGFVFKNCIVTGNGKVYLGRPWRAYARVVFYQTFMSDVVLPLGWDAWYNAGGREGLLTFKEIDCRGSGANTSGRVGWADKLQLGRGELQELLSISYIDGRDWLLQM